MKRAVMNTRRHERFKFSHLRNDFPKLEKLWNNKCNQKAAGGALCNKTIIKSAKKTVSFALEDGNGNKYFEHFVLSSDVEYSLFVFIMRQSGG